ncbi:hypothetical protein ACFQS4_16975 [Saliphagus sp. GCM10025317]
MTTRNTNLTGTTHLERIERTALPASVSALLETYEETVDERDRFLWKWLYYLFPEITLSCVRPDDSQQVRESKLLVSLYVTILDDLAERDEDVHTFREATKAPFDHRVADETRPEIDAAAVSLAHEVWEHVDDRLESAPRYPEFRDLLRFDLDRTTTAIEYTYLLNHHLELASLEETAIYDSHNMMLFTYAAIDLLYSPAFDRSELGRLREVLRRAQQMTRIGNWVTTWERELEEGDCSSGVVVSAVERGVVSREQLERLRADPATADRDKIVARIQEANIEDRLLERWSEHYEHVEGYATDVESVDVGALLEGLETVLACHLESRGRK